MMLLGFVCLKTLANTGGVDRINVPEPMFIDLVRSLDSKKGEVEVNSLFAIYDKNYANLDWAPEIEFVIADGHAVEFELPSQGSSLLNYKFAYQTTFQSISSKSTLQGFQLIYEVDKEFSHSDSTWFHIIASRLNEKFSYLILSGLRLDHQDISNRSIMFNPTLFYNYRDKLDFGLELNLESSELGDELQQILPQVHLTLNQGYVIQFGVGLANYQNKEGYLTSFRLIKEFEYH